MRTAVAGSLGVLLCLGGSREGFLEFEVDLRSEELELLLKAENARRCKFLSKLKNLSEY